MNRAKYFSEVPLFRALPVVQKEKKLLDLKMHKRKLAALGSPQLLVEYSVYIIHIVEQFGICVSGKQFKCADTDTEHESVRLDVLHFARS